MFRLNRSPARPLALSRRHLTPREGPRRTSRRCLVGAISSGLLLLAVACAPSQPGATATNAAASDIPEIIVQGHDFAFTGPDQVEAGLVKITLENDGKEPHQANLARLQDGKTLDDLAAAMKQSPEAALPLLEFVGGPNTIDPHGRQEVIAKLREGTYVMICFVASPDGTPHVAKGMIKPLKVVASSKPTASTDPKTDGVATLKDFTIAVPSSVKAGRQTWKVVNDGAEPHELTLIRLAPGKMMQDVTAYLAKPSGPPPFEDAGGIGALSPGVSGWAVLDLQPGSYVALCFVPDPKTGKAHVDLGMVTPFTVAPAN